MTALDVIAVSLAASALAGSVGLFLRVWRRDRVERRARIAWKQHVAATYSPKIVSK